MSPTRRSKKRSATSSEPPPEPLTYFIDRDLGTGPVPAAIESMGAHVELHRDHFPQAAPDVDWIPYASGRRWVILTQDRAILRHPHEQEAVIAARARYFCVAGGSRRGTETAAMLAKHFRWIDGLARAMPAPIIARVMTSGVRFKDLNGGVWVPVRKRHLRRATGRHT